MRCGVTRSFCLAMAELRLNSDMTRLATQYRVRFDWPQMFQKTYMRSRMASRDPADIGRIGCIGHERELLWRE